MDHPRFIDVDGIRTRYFEAGRGDPLVLIHGGVFGQYLNAYDWSCAFDALTDRFHVYAPDKLGAGYTDNPENDEAYTMTRTIEHLYRFLLAVGLQRAVVVGHSRGALPAARIAIDHPELVKALVIVASQTLAADHPSSHTKDFYERLSANAPAVPDADYVRREIDANSYSHDHITSDLVQEKLAIARLPKIQLATRKMASPLVREQFLADVQTRKYETLDMIRDGCLVAPTLVVWGLNDVSAPIVLAYQLFEHIALGVRQTQLHVFNEARHYPHREHPHAFAQVLMGFVQTLDPVRKLSVN